MRQRLRVALLLATLALGFGYFLGRTTSRARPAAATPNDRSDALNVRKETPRRNLPVAKPVANAATKAAPLPPPGAPLAKIYDELVARARSGDATAAMRLFSDLQRCAARKTQSSMLNLVTGMRDAGTYASDPKALAEADAWTKKSLDALDASDAFCAELTQEQIKARHDWLRSAALDGDAEAMVCYAMSPNEFGPKFLSDAWFDWTQRWQEEAPQFAAQAFAAGQADVIGLLLDAYGNESLIPGDNERFTTFQFGQLVAPDPMLAYVYALLYERVVPQSTLQIAHSRAMLAQARLTPEQIAQAQTLADTAWPRFAKQAGDRSNVIPCRDLIMTNQFND